MGALKARAAKRRGNGWRTRYGLAEIEPRALGLCFYGGKLREPKQKQDNNNKQEDKPRPAFQGFFL